MACKVYRNPVTQEIDQVLTENDKPSKLYKSILDLGIDKETALNKWALTYTPTFKNWFQNGNKDANGEPIISIIDNTPVFVAEDGSTKHATENLGSFSNPRSSELLNEINQRFNLRTPQGRAINIPWGAYSIAEKIEKLYPGVDAVVARDYGGDIIHLSISSSLNPENIYHQLENDTLQEADTQIDEAMRDFLQTLGIKVQLVNEIRDKHGKPIKAAAKADMVNKIVQIVEGKAKIDTLPEEAAHFFVELLEASGNPLFQSMMNNIDKYSVYDDVNNNEVYQKLYNGDKNKIKKEAVGKLIAQQIVKNKQGKDTPAQLKRAQTWFDKIMNFINRLFGKVSTDPYSKAAYIILNNKAGNYMTAEKVMGGIQGEYYQVDDTHTVNPLDNIVKKFEETQV